jgi:L-lysine 2,3-aminomutase
MICLSFATGIWTAKNTFNDNYLLPLTNRINILDQFKSWLDINPIKVKGVEAVKKEVEQELKLKLEKEYSEKLNTAKKEIQDQAIKLVEEFQKSQDIKGVA